MRVFLPRTDSSRIAHSLGRVADFWLDRSHPIRQEAVQALAVSTGLNAALVEQGLAAAFEELTELKILNYVEAESISSKCAQAPDKVLHILAGNVFTSWLPGAVTTLLLGADCVLKPSSQERVFAPLWKKSVEQADPALGIKIRLVEWEDALLFKHPAIVAYGSDETLNVLKSQISSRVRFIGYGHKFSVGIIWKDALQTSQRETLREQLRNDIEPFHLQGCLSPQILYLEKEPPEAVQELLAGVPVSPRVESFESWEALRLELKSFAPHLSTIGYAGLWPSISKEQLQDLGITRVCPIGKMHRPPLTWRNGGFSLVDALTA